MGSDSKLFVLEVSKNSSEGAVLENFRDFSEKLFLKNIMISESLSIWG